MIELDCERVAERERDKQCTREHFNQGGQRFGLEQSACRHRRRRQPLLGFVRLSATDHSPRLLPNAGMHSLQFGQEPERAIWTLKNVYTVFRKSKEISLKRISRGEKVFSSTSKEQVGSCVSKNA